MKKEIYISCLFIMVWTSLASAQETNAPSLRDPFWPVGYEKPVNRVIPQDSGVISVAIPRPETGLIWPEPRVTGVSRGRGGKYFVMIEDHGVAFEGDVVSILKDQVWYYWEIRTIDAGGIKEKVKLETRSE